ncbi:lateral signaling target protein 2 homolog [Ptychodera flava]|uniref:lateral signaling target protein 2 homolog n=1 Tax=Ptychodera flava TaxID=63121 RepID=UPI003969E0A0
MFSLRKWLYKPKKTDTQLLAQFYYADEELNEVAIELDSFDGRKDPERCTALVNQLRSCQDKVLTIVNEIMDVAIPTDRANRDFRVKFPDDVLQDTLAGQLWFGAECLAAGSTIMNREMESAALRPRAKEVIRSLDCLRTAIRDQCLRNLNVYTDKIRETLVQFDKIFADFEYSYVSAMVPVKTARDLETQQEVVVLFCETIARALNQNLLSQDQIDSCDPALMFTIPRLAIVCGLLIYPDGPLNCDMEPCEMSEMFRPFHSLLYKIRELLHTLSDKELFLLEKALSSAEERWESLEQDLSTPTNENSGVPSMDVPIAQRRPQCENEISSPSSGSVQSDSSSSTVKMDQSPACSVQSNQSESIYSQTDMSTSVAAHQTDQSETVCVETDQSETVCVETDQSETMCVETDHSETVCVETDQSETVCVETDQSVQNESAIERDCNLTNRTSNSQNEFSDRDITTTPGQSESDFIEPDVFSRKLNVLPRPGLPSDISVSVDFRQEFATITIRPEAIPSISQSSQTITEDDREISEYIEKPSSEVVTLDTADTGGVCERSDVHSNPHVRDNQYQSNVVVAHTSSAPTPSDSVSVRFNSDEVLSMCTVVVDDIVQKVVEIASQSSPPEGSVRTGRCVQTKNSKTCEATEKGECSIERGGCSGGGHCSPDNQAQGNDNAECEQFLPEGMIKKSDTVLFKPSGSCMSCANYLDPTENPEPLEHSKFVPLKGHDSDFSSPDSPLSDSENFCVTNSELLTPERTLPAVIKDTESENPSQARTEACHLDKGQVSEETSQENTSSLENSVVRENHSVEGSSVGASSGLHQYQINNRAIGEAIVTQDGTFISSGFMDGLEVDNGYQWESDESASSTETSSYTSECQDESEISMAIQAAELAAKQQARAHFSSAGDLIHRLFVCISGVADQLQTNFAADLRNILKTVFEVCVSSDSEVFYSGANSNMEQGAVGTASMSTSTEGDERRQSRRSRNSSGHEEPPPWVPDEECSNCTSCQALFTVIRRKHHCRNCGMIFCGRCSANSVPLPRYGVMKPVRVCTRCYMFHVTPFLR